MAPGLATVGGAEVILANVILPVPAPVLMRRCNSGCWLASTSDGGRNPWLRRALQVLPALMDGRGFRVRRFDGAAPVTSNRACVAMPRRGDDMTHPHILLVDDEHIILDVLEANLSDAGFKISRASTSDAALEIFERDDVQLLMTDIRMPGSADGIVLASRMREKKPDLPVIFLSGNLDGLANSDRLACPSAFLVKPVDVNDAIDTINLLISGHSDPAALVQNRAASDNR
jgi:CheY-like chemotaxis protein